MDRLTRRDMVNGNSGVWVTEKYEYSGLETFFDENEESYSAIEKCAEYEDAEEQGLLVRLPCKVGDTVWGIRRYKRIKYPQQGVVSEMYFLPDMSLQIVVKHLCRGKFGEIVFLTREEAEQALREKGSE